MKFRALLVLIPILLMATPAAAEYLVKGSVPCPKLIEEDSNEKFRLANEWWILGYITARNFHTSGNKGDNLKGEVFYSYALNYCHNNPDRDLDDASIELYDWLN